MTNCPYHEDPSGRIVLVCPRCREELTVLDVENYPSCPYCDWKFPTDGKLEEFILDPIVRSWVARVSEPGS